MNRVLHIVHSMGAGGIETFLMNIYRTIDQRNIQFDFLVYSKEEMFYDKEILNLGGVIHRLPSRREGIVRNYNALKDFFKSHTEYKVIHYHVSSLTDITPLVVATQFKVPIRIVHSHNTMQRGFIHKCLHKFNQRLIKRYATHYFGCSELALRWLYGSKMVDTGLCRVIYNAIDVDKFIFDENTRATMRSALSLGNDQLVIGCIGRFAYQKNHTFLLDIFCEMLKRKSDCKLILVGNGELEQSVVDKIQSLNFIHNVIVLSNRSDIPQLLSTFDVFVLPSLHEGLGIVYIEAQAIGIPAIASNEVPNEAKVLDSMQFISLSKSASEWADIVLDAAATPRIKDAHELVAKAGYDISKTAKSLEKIYLEAYK